MEITKGQLVEVKKGTAHSQAWWGVRGEVISVHDNLVKTKIDRDVKTWRLFAKGDTVAFFKRSLEVIEGPRIISYDEIKVGDRVKATRRYTDGAEVVSSGVVHSMTDRYALSETGVYLCFSRSPVGEYEIQLLDRPEWKIPEGRGAIIEFELNTQKMYRMMKTHTDKWTGVYTSVHGADGPVKWTENELFGYLSTFNATNFKVIAEGAKS